MDLNLNTEQKILKNSARDFLKKECPRDLFREMRESDEDYPKKLWKKMAEDPEFFSQKWDRMAMTEELKLLPQHTLILDLMWISAQCFKHRKKQPTWRLKMMSI